MENLKSVLAAYIDAYWPWAAVFVAGLVVGLIL